MLLRWRASENYLGAVIWPLLFGPLALIDYSLIGFFVMIVPWLISFALLFVFVGIFLLPLVHVVCIVWALAAVPVNRRRRLRLRHSRFIYVGGA